MPIALTNFSHSVIDPEGHTINMKWEVPDADKVVYYLDSVLKKEGMCLHPTTLINNHFSANLSTFENSSEAEQIQGLIERKHVTKQDPQS